MSQFHKISITKCSHRHGRPHKFFQGGNVDILIIFFWLLAMQIDVCKKENVQCYGNSYIQCLPCKKTLHWANVCL